MKKPQARLTAAQIENALRAKAGNVAAAARELQVSRSTLYRRINASAALRDLLADAREELVDIAESALRKQVIEGNTTAIIFALKTLGKQRGYVERTESVNFNVDPALLKQAIEAIEAAGLEPSQVFNDLIAQAAELKQNAGAAGPDAESG